MLDKNAPVLSLENNFYKLQLEKCLAVNIFKDGEWGSYQSLFLENSSTVSAQHAFLDWPISGNVSTLRWLEGPLNPKWSVNFAEVD